MLFTPPHDTETSFDNLYPDVPNGVLDLASLPSSALVCDIVYVPLETDLLKAAKADGHPVIDGIGMLLHQARPGFAAWFGIEPVVDQALTTYVLAAAGAGT